MEEIKKAEETAREFLKGKFKIYQPTLDQMDIMVRTVISKNEAETLDELFFEVKEVLDERGFPNPKLDRILNWMFAIAIKNSVSPSNEMVGIRQTKASYVNGLCVNY